VVSRRLLARPISTGATPGFADSVTVDIDSTLWETYGLGKDGAREVRTGRRGYHPLVAVIAGLGDVAHARLRRRPVQRRRRGGELHHRDHHPSALGRRGGPDRGARRLRVLSPRRGRRLPQEELAVLDHREHDRWAAIGDRGDP